tara:strand:+ start:232 stop:546 length:315 start_codon:yes stop_codon:yes gene_type:complete
MTTKEKNIILSITPVYETTGSFQRPMPNEITLFLDDGKWYIEISLKESLLQCEIWNNEKQIFLSKEDIIFVYNYTEGLLSEEIELTKRYYDEQSYEQDETYYIV